MNEMSHADGLAILPDGTMYHYEYNGTCDICCTRLYKDYEEMHQNWRKDNLRDCICDQKEYKKVVLTTAYGHWDFLWTSEICEECMCIVGKIHDWE